MHRPNGTRGQAAEMRPVFGMCPQDKERALKVGVPKNKPILRVY
jgi:hypothetical protein